MALDISEMQALRDNLYRNIKLGIRSVTHEGTSRTFQDLDEMRAELTRLDSDIAAESGSGRQSRATLIQSGGFE